MLPAVTNLRVLSQSGAQTTFGWDTVTDADNYAVTLDGTAYATVAQSATPTVTVTAQAGSHDLGVAPVANPTPAATLPFTVPSGGGGTVPPAPTNFKATLVTASEVDLACDPIPTATGYNWYKKSTLYKTTTVPMLQDTAVAPSTTYHYNVQGVNAAGVGPRATAINVTTPASGGGGTPPPVPTGLADSGTTATSTTLKCNASTGATGYVFEEVGSGTTWATTAPTVSITGLSPSTTLTFAVAAVGPGGQSAFSAPITVTTLAGGGGGGGGFLSDVVIIMEENEAAKSIIGSSSAPYFNSLLPLGALAEPMNNCHPSEPNYLTAVSGNNWGLAADTPGFTVSASTILDLLDAAGIPWVVLMESMPAGKQLTDTSLYVQKHNPFVHFLNIRNNPARMAKIIPYSDSFWSTWQGGYVWVSPNLTNDGHSPGGQTGVANADKWLKQKVPLIQASAPFKRAGSKAALNITWDESEGSGSTGCAYPGYAPPFVSFWIGPGVKVNYRSSATYQGHASELATIEAGLGLPNLGQHDASSPVMRDLFP